VYNLTVSTIDQPAVNAAAARLDEASLALEDLHGVLSEEEPIEEVLQRLVETALRLISGADAVSITVVAGERPRTAAASDDKVIAIDSDQYAAGQGPCLEAARTRRPVRVGVDTARAKWPEFAAAAERAGVRAYLSAPLVVDDDSGEVVGALNVYGFDSGAFDPFDEALLRLFTTAASASITNSSRYARSRSLAENLERALVSRATIDQAKGVLMAVHGISEDEAFQRLVEQSQNSNTKLNQVARNLLDSVRTSPTVG
jgi:GAF domain-containing protein